tara:strand:- start:965 stop:1870 length:906 start_codon:yes stop_codon:yes gene_type:complete
MLLVTGCSGPSAKYFFKKLSENNYKGQIRCIVRKSSNINHLKKYKLKLSFVYGDIRDEIFLVNSMKDIEVVLHIANIKFSENIVRAGSKVGVSWFICVHTAAVYSKYTKLSSKYNSIEKKLISNHSNVTILRPSLIYGTGGDPLTTNDKKKDRKVWMIIKFIHRYNFFLVFGSGKTLLQPVHCKDLGEAYYSVLLNKKNTFGKNYNLSGRNKISYLSMIKTISSYLEKKIIVVHLPIWLSFIVVKTLSLIPIISISINTEQILRMNEDRIFSWQKARSDFGYSPLTFEEGVKMEIDNYLNK